MLFLTAYFIIEYICIASPYIKLQHLQGIQFYKNCSQTPKSIKLKYYSLTKKKSNSTKVHGNWAKTHHL